MEKNKLATHEKWMRYALELAHERLLQGEFPVGCVLVANDTIVASGGRINSKGQGENELDHAEMEALREWVRHGRPGKNVIAYSTLEPCLMCMGALLINGVSQVVFSYEDVMGGACGLDFDSGFSTIHRLEYGRGQHLYRGAGKRIVPWVLREDGLALFEAFFSNPSNKYLRGTLLDRYTRETARKVNPVELLKEEERRDVLKYKVNGKKGYG